MLIINFIKKKLALLLLLIKIAVSQYLKKRSNFTEQEFGTDARCLPSVLIYAHSIRL